VLLHAPRIQVASTAIRVGATASSSDSASFDDSDADGDNRQLVDMMAR
jgi:hypothetical protein